MKTITIARASKPDADDPVGGVIIAVTETVPDFSGKGYLEAYGTFYQGEAEKIADALQAALPGGVLNRLTAELLKRAAGYLRVPIHKEES
jgi:hypothetical protein